MATPPWSVQNSWNSGPYSGADRTKVITVKLTEEELAQLKKFVASPAARVPHPYLTGRLCDAKQSDVVRQAIGFFINQPKLPGADAPSKPKRRRAAATTRTKAEVLRGQ